MTGLVTGVRRSREGGPRPPLALRGAALLGMVVASVALGACSRSPAYQHPTRGSQSLFRSGPNEGEPAADRSGPTLVVVTLDDTRSMEHREGMTSWLEEHGGFTGEVTTHDAAYERPLAEMASDALAEALRSTGRFGRVLRASPGEEMEADLVLTGRLRRLRGWQAYRVERDEPSRVLESMGDVFIDEIEIESVSLGRLVFIGQTGAMNDEVPGKVDPYAVAQQAFDQAEARLVAAIADSGLDEPLEREVRMSPGRTGDLEELLGELPPGWSGSCGGPGCPSGWAGDADCRAISLEDYSRSYYHPRLGFFSPAVDLWVCPRGWEGELRISAEGQDRFPATVIGFTEKSEALLGLSVGKTSWPTAFHDLALYLGLDQPAGGPVLRLPEGVEMR